ncbi:MAG: hypothetical protein A3J29_03720 [Acidobacteria bacterium RIFCSPLOWO2_12_FULL_67_14b]|nr:MAG: hypothetical protein A3J29_03720 [Acidobacteria bacterium RIFCSPLOWO2_12_FULL_67_14b]
MSGATLLRPGFQAMMQSALRKEVEVVLAESLDRFSRDQEDTAGLFTRLRPHMSRHRSIIRAWPTSTERRSNSSPPRSRPMAAAWKPRRRSVGSLIRSS